MDTFGRKTPVPLPLAGWQALTPEYRAREVYARILMLPTAVRNAAIVQARSEADLARDFAEADQPKPGPLRGAPYFLKDLFDVAGSPTAAGSTFLASIRPVAGDGAVVTRLRECGAVLAGKSQLVEFASGLTGENPHFGDCPHPRFPGRLAGGSSSGSAALVAAGVVPLSIGSDTGGSIRVPAAFCGLFGFRLCPRDRFIADAFPLAPSLDTAGGFAATAGDLLALYEAFAGTVPAPGAALRGCYAPGSVLGAVMDPAIESACARAAAGFSERIDSATQDALVAGCRGAVDAYATIGMSEANAIHRDWLAPYRAHYDPVIWQRFSDAGRYPHEQLDGAAATRRKVMDFWHEFFGDHDFLVFPSAPCVAPRKAECTPELRRNILALTAPASLGGLPCLAIPVGLGDGLTAGLQVVFKDVTSAAIPWVLAKF